MLLRLEGVLMLVHFPGKFRVRHGRASAGSGLSTGERAANVVIIAAVRPAAFATVVSRIADHHSDGIESRCHHLDTAEALAPMSDAMASFEGHSSMMDRNEDVSDINNPLRQFVLFGKANLSHDCGRGLDHAWGMAKREGVSEYKQRFLARVTAARDSQGFTQDQIAVALGMEQPKYAKYEVRSLLPHYLVEQFCVVCHVTEKWLVTGKGIGPAVPEALTKTRKPRKRRTQKKAA